MLLKRFTGLCLASVAMLAFVIDPVVAATVIVPNVPTNGAALYLHRSGTDDWIAQEGDNSGQGKSTGTFSATIAAFHQTSTGTPITATTGGVTGTLPSGTEVLISNMDTTNAEYCKLGASVSTGDIKIVPGGTFPFGVSGETQFTCKSVASTVVTNIIGGDGLPSGAGNGGSSSGGGGAMTVADGADVALGALADAAVTTSASGSISAKLRGIISLLNSGITVATHAVTQSGTWNITNISGTISLPTGAALEAGGNLASLVAGLGATSGAKVCTDANGTVQQYLRCLASNSANTLPVIASGVSTAVIGCDKTAIYDASTSGSTELVSLTSGQTIYVCGYVMRSSTTAVNGELDYGTGTACATGNTKMTPAYQMTTYDGQSDPAPFWRGMKTAVANALCFKASAAQPVQLTVYYTKF